MLETIAIILVILWVLVGAITIGALLRAMRSKTSS